ncbi:MAG: hypothetical protein GY906_20870, partial [bacterium]|nr:hypothetical protein [bacterium]
MTDNDRAYTIASSSTPQVLTISSGSGQEVAAPVIHIGSGSVGSQHSALETIEHVAPSKVSRCSSSSDDIDLLIAREEAARLAQEASQAKLALLEARAKSKKSS